MADGERRRSSSPLAAYRVDGANKHNKNSTSEQALVQYGNIHGDITNHYARSKDYISVTREALLETDPEIDRKNLMQAKGERVKGTCDWILEDEHFKSWIRGDTSILAITGGPGQGKTMLADFIISQLESKTATDDAVTLTYFFCTREDSRRNNISSILRGVLYYLLCANPTLENFFLPYLSSRTRNDSVLSSPDTLWKILTAIADAGTTGTIMCVLDGLDECTEVTHSFLGRRLTERKDSRTLRVALLSRPLHAFETFTQIRLESLGRVIGHDIAAYITKRLEELGQVLQLDASIRQELHEQLVTRAQGTYLWIELVIAELLRQSTQSAVQERLSELPVGLQACYERLLGQIPRSKRERCRTILLWTTVSDTPVYLSEMAMVLDLEPQAQNVSIREPDILDLVADSRGLLVVQNGRISLVHQSAREYLLRNRADPDPDLEYWRFDYLKARVELLEARTQMLRLSHADGVWDDVTDVGSVASDLSSATTLDGTLVTDDLIAKYVNAIFHTEKLRVLHRVAITDPSIGPDGLRRNLGHLIRRYGRDLKEEISKKDEIGAARLLRNRGISSRAALAVVGQMSEDPRVVAFFRKQGEERYGSKLKAPTDSHETETNADGGGHADSEQTNSENLDGEDSESDDSDIGDDDAANVEQSILELEPFLTQSKAYAQFCDRLLQYTHTPYEKRVQKVLGQSVVSETGERLSPVGLEVMAAEISWIPQYRLSTDRTLHVTDYIKSSIEQFLGESLQWWPMTPPKQPLLPDYIRLEWHSPCGDTHHIDIPREQEKALQNTLSLAPDYVTSQAYTSPRQTAFGTAATASTPPAASSQGNCGSASGTTTTTAHRKPKGTGSNQPEDNQHGKPPPGGDPPGSNAPGGVNRSYVQQQSNTVIGHVYLGVRCRDMQFRKTYKFSGIAVRRGMSDQRFFNELRDEYRRKRGYWRRFLSWTRYHHCEFYEFKKHPMGTGAPSRVAFPTDDPDYEFDPRPMHEPHPIDKMEFYNWFYNIGNTTPSRRFWRPVSFTRAVGLLPKRITPLNIDDGEREVFWGLLAVQRRAFAWIFAYFWLFNLPGIVFFFLFWSKHPDDLQNAAVPIGLSLSFSIGYAALIHGTKEAE